MTSSKLPRKQDGERDRRAGLPGLGAWLEAVSPTPAREFSCRAIDAELRPDLAPRPVEPDPVITVEVASSFPPDDKGHQEPARSARLNRAAGPETSESSAQEADRRDPAARWTTPSMLAKLRGLLRQ